MPPTPRYWMGGISRANHNAAGPELHDECLTLGDVKITKGYNLPARHIIHTVGPVGEQPAALSSCYRRALELLLENGLRSICFCCISTGIYGYPNRKAARVALSTVWLQKYSPRMDSRLPRNTSFPGRQCLGWDLLGVFSVAGNGVTLLFCHQAPL